MRRVKNILVTIGVFLCVLLSNRSEAQVKAGFSAAVTSGCSPLVVQFKDSSTGIITSWQWDLGNGTVSNVQNPSAIYNAPGVYTVKLTVRGLLSVDSVIKTGYVQVYDNPVINFTTSSVSWCVPLPVQFTDQSTAGSGTITKYTWDFGDGSVSTSANPLHVYQRSGNYGISLTVTNSYGCSSFTQKPTLITAANTTAAFNYTYANPCQVPVTVSFTNQSTSTSTLTYQWSFGDGGSSTQASPTHLYSKTGTYNCTLIAKSSTGCADTIVQPIVIGLVQPDFTAPATACVNTALAFTNTSVPTPSSVTWNFGDGSTATTINAIHTYTTAGTYNVTMAATFGSCTQVATHTVTINTKPTAAFSVSGNRQYCSLPATVSFANQSTNANSFQWSFGDGATATGTNPSYTYTAAGNYTVTLVAVNSNGCTDTLVKEQYLNIQPPQVTNINGLPFKGCVPATVTMHPVVVSAEPVASWAWDLGDGTSATDSVPTHVYIKPGSYTVVLTITTQSGCTSTYRVPNAVITDTIPPVNFIADPLNACASMSVSFTDQSGGNILSWQWSFGDNSTSLAQNPTHKYGDTGTYNITLIVTNTACSDTLTKANYVHVLPPIARFNVNYTCSDRYTRTFTDMSIGGVTRVWDFGDGTTDTSLNPVHTYAASGQYTVTETVTNGICTDIKMTTVSILVQHPYIVQSPTDSSLCKYTQIQLSAAGYAASSIVAFNWNFGDGTGSNAGAVVTHAYAASGNYTPVLITTDVQNCSDTMQVSPSLHVFGPAASFSNVAGTCLSNGNISFNDNSATDGIHNIVQWSWAYGDGATDNLTAGPFAHQYTSAGSYTVTLSVTDSYGCKDSLIKPGDVLITNPKAAFALSDSVKCTNNTVSFNNLSSGSPSFTYLWSFGDNNTSTAASPTYTYGAEGTYTVSLLIQDAFGCRDSVTKLNALTVSNPRASFALTDTFASCPPLGVIPQNTSTSAYSYTWYFDDGNSSVLANPTHYYTQGGNYHLTLVAQGYGACTDTAHRLIVVKGPSGSLSYTPLTGCAPLPETFTAISRNSVNTIMDFSDGNVITTQDSILTHTYTTFGNFVPRIILTDTANCKVSINGIDTIHVVQIKARASEVVLPGCDSSKVSFKDSSSVYNDQVNNYAWSFGDRSGSTDQFPVHYYDSSAVYAIRLVVTSNTGCTDTLLQQLPVLVHESPKVRILAVDSACVYSSVYMGFANLLNDSLSTFNWNLGDGNTNNANILTHTYATYGSFAVTLAVTDIYGCSGKDTHPLTIMPLPPTDAGANTAICYGSNIQLKPSGAYTYVWNADTTLSCSACTNPVAQPHNTTRYYVTGTSQFGCVASDSILVKVQQPIQLTASSNDTLCEGESVRLHASGAEVYTWMPAAGLNNPNIASPIASPNVTTTYTVVGSDSIHCFAQSQQVNIKVYPIPVLHVADTSVTVQAGYTDTLFTTASPDVTHYTWVPSQWLSCNTCASPGVTPKGDITYKVTVTNDGGCSTSQNVNVVVVCNNANVFIPNTFSPNGDGANDIFYPRGRGIFMIRSLRIFNRWGQEVFVADNFAPNDASKGWNGTFKGQTAPADVYVYMIDIICENNAIITTKGNVSLLR